jgi:hypothetical protein
VTPRTGLPSLARDPWLYAVALFTLAFCAPVFRWVLWLGDEGVIVHGAARIGAGQVPYRDFFEFLPPGSFLTLAAWLKVFGDSFASVRALAVATLAVIAALVYAAARLANARRVIAGAVALACIVRASLDTNHHWLTTAASLACGVALLTAVRPGGPTWLPAFAAGLFAGAAAMITTTRGASLALAVIIVLLATPDRLHRIIPALAGLALVPGAVVAYLAAAGALAAAFDDVIAFPFRHYAGIHGVPFGAFATQADAGVVAFFPLTFLLAAAAVALRRWRTPEFQVAVVLAVVGLVGAYPRPDTPHLAFVVPLAAPLFAVATSEVLGALGPRLRVVVGVLVIAAFAWHIGYGIVRRAIIVSRPVQTIVTPRGRAESPQSIWAGEVASLVTGIASQTPGDARFFFYPYLPMLPYLTARRHVGHLDVVLPGYTTAAQYRTACAEVIDQAQWVVIDRNWSDVNFLRRAYPALADPDRPAKRAFEAALRQGFERVHQSTMFEVRRRTPAAAPALCEAITVAASRRALRDES